MTRNEREVPRRTVLIGGATAAVWTAPVVTSISVAHGATGSPRPGINPKDKDPKDKDPKDKDPKDEDKGKGGAKK